MKLTRRHPKRGRVEIIPMIDTILILLIFYMSFLTFSAKEKKIDAKLPQVSTKVSPTNVPLDIAIHVKDSDHIIVNGGEFNSETLRDFMKMMQGGQDATVVISADPGTSYQAVIYALDACAEAHLSKVAFRPISEKATAPN